MYTLPDRNVNRVSTRRKSPQKPIEWMTVYGDLTGKAYIIPKQTTWHSLPSKTWKKKRRYGGKCADSLRKRVFAAFSACQYCGYTWSLSVDRIIPGCEGGRYTADNVTAACFTCNSKRAHGTVYGPVRPLSAMEGRNG